RSSTPGEPHGYPPGLGLRSDATPGLPRNLPRRPRVERRSGYIVRLHVQEFNSFHRKTRSKALHEFKLHRQEKLLWHGNTAEALERLVNGPEPDSGALNRRGEGGR